MTRRSLLALTSLWLAACAASAPEPSRYLLDFPEPPTGRLLAPAPGPRLYVAEVRVADYLAGAGIVYQTDVSQVHPAGGHRWAEPLPAQLRRGLADVLATRLERLVLVPEAGAGADRLEVYVDSFQGRFDGTARVAGQWRLHGPGGELLTGRRFRVEVPLEADGYPALVRALSAAWAEVAGDVAASYAGLHPSSP